jgi:hypothetical protein
MTKASSSPNFRLADDTPGTGAMRKRITDHFTRPASLTAERDRCLFCYGVASGNGRVVIMAIGHSVRRFPENRCRA